MCKIFAMTNMSQVTLDRTFLESVRDAVCAAHDRDGFGYATVDGDGNLFGERSTSPFDFIPLADRPASERVQGLPIVSPAHNSFGVAPSTTVKSMIAHGRMSTNTVSLPNTHPFTDGNAALIHNGVVSDAGNVVKGHLTTDCDSEILLRLWTKAGMDAVEAHSAGYYAIAVLDSSGLLHVARDSRARLVIAYSPTVDSYLLATTAEIIAAIADANDWDIGAIEPVKDNTYAVFNWNDIVSYRDINPIGYASGISSGAASRALGTDIPAYREDSMRGHVYDDDDSAGSISYRDLYADEESRLNDDDGPIGGEDLTARTKR